MKNECKLYSFYVCVTINTRIANEKKRHLNMNVSKLHLLHDKVSFQFHFSFDSKYTLFCSELNHLCNNWLFVCNCKVRPGFHWRPNHISKKKSMHECYSDVSKEMIVIILLWICFCPTLLTLSVYMRCDCMPNPVEET